MNASRDSWTERKEGGTRLAIWLIRGIARYGGRPIARAFLYPITGYFVLRRARERRDAMRYLARVLGRPSSWLDFARHVHTFSSTILDRVFLLSGRLNSFDVTVGGLEALHRDLDQGRGVLLFGSHLGSFEVLRVLARERPDYTIRVVLDKQMSPMLTELLDELNPAIAAGVIDASQDGPTVVMAIQQACAAGALVALLVDRARPGEAALPAQFFGQTAWFPTSPWLIASVLKVPVQLGFGLYRGGNCYELLFEPFVQQVDAPRGAREAALSALIARYASRLEHVTRSAPYNWFNFYDFWQPPSRDAHLSAQAVPNADARHIGRQRGRADGAGGDA